MDIVEVDIVEADKVAGELASPLGIVAGSCTCGSEL